MLHCQVLGPQSQIYSFQNESVNEKRVDVFDYLEGDVEEIDIDQVGVVVLFSVDPPEHEISETVLQSLHRIKPLQRLLGIKLFTDVVFYGQMQHVVVDRVGDFNSVFVLGLLDVLLRPVSAVLALVNVKFVVLPHQQHAMPGHRPSHPHDHRVEPVQPAHQQHVTRFNKPFIQMEIAFLSLFVGDSLELFEHVDVDQQLVFGNFVTYYSPHKKSERFEYADNRVSKSSALLKYRHSSGSSQILNLVVTQV